MPTIVGLVKHCRVVTYQNGVLRKYQSCQHPASCIVGSFSQPVHHSFFV
jgi:hypothetical protein